jgi:hypothetical protein
MNQDIETMLTACEGRYPTRAEQALLRDWATRLEARLAAVEEIKQAEEAIIAQTVDEVFRNYPDFEKRYKNARQSCTRDETLVLRYCAQALMRGDAAYLENSLLSWMATILKGVGFTPQFIFDTYETMGRVAARELSPQAAELLRPYVELCATALSGKSKDTP